MKALVLANMGGARNKEELKEFLENMFNDKNILPINPLVRKVVSKLIVLRRLDSVWENYKKIEKSPIYDLTNKLIENIDYENVFYVMRYTKPTAKELCKILKEKKISEVILLPLYPQYSTTTTQSTYEDFVSNCDIKFRLIEPFYKNEIYNNLILEEIYKHLSDDTNIIFSAHSLPKKIIDKGDPYERQIQEHINILKSKITKKYKSINLAYQSKIGPVKWLEPSLDKVLKNFKNQKVLIYPISFIIDNSETILELGIEYKELAKEYNIDYTLCSCLNEKFAKVVKDLVDD